MNMISVKAKQVEVAELALLETLKSSFNCKNYDLFSAANAMAIIDSFDASTKLNPVTTKPPLVRKRKFIKPNLYASLKVDKRKQLEQNCIKMPLEYDASAQAQTLISNQKFEQIKR